MNVIYNTNICARHTQYSKNFIPATCFGRYIAIVKEFQTPCYLKCNTVREEIYIRMVVTSAAVSMCCHMHSKPLQ
jgi:hypothetical protein